MTGVQSWRKFFICIMLLLPEYIRSSCTIILFYNAKKPVLQNQVDRKGSTSQMDVFTTLGYKKKL